ncbi:glycosyltransferase family 2 protein [Streptomyces sp. NPDC060035]|uniref:glycosyltransferase family 2 protein n=1 Tax=Streptomyces sp. NPDC060035 TaxID=3347044 RepID=UPI00368277BB
MTQLGTSPRVLNRAELPAATPGTPRSLVLVPALSEPGRLPKVVGSVLDTLDTDVLVLDAGGNAFNSSVFPGQVSALGVPPGVGSAVRSGLEYAMAHGYEVVTRIDGDGQHAPAVLHELLERQKNGTDLVLGSRYHPLSPVVAAPPSDRIALNVMFRSLVQQVCGLAMTDVISGCWAMSRKTMTYLVPRIRVQGYGSTLEILMLLGLSGQFSIAEVPHPAIYAGQSIEERYTKERLAARCTRAAVYLEVVADVMDRHDIRGWPLLVQR